MSNSFVRFSLLVVAAAFYLFYTYRYYKELRKSVYFSGGIKRFHLFAIWLVPFIWILFLKAITKATPGSHEVKNKSDGEPWSDPYAAPTDVTVD